MNENAMQKALRECVDRLGAGILTDKTKFKGVINDMLPGIDFVNERNLLIFAADNLRIGENLLKAPTGDEARKSFCQYQLKQMTEGGLSREAAETVLRAFTLALGWKVQVKPTSAPAPQPAPTPVPAPKPVPPPPAPKPAPPTPAPSGQPSNYWAPWVFVLAVLAFAFLIINFHDFQKSNEVSKPSPAASTETSNSVPAASLSAAYADKQVGERFEFGRYPQGPNGEVKPITWQVLKRESDALLVISELCLDAKPYNNENKEITWSDCSLRRWLNGEFLQKAFNGQEQSLIKKSRLDNNAGPSTEDRIFLLSIDEAESLFANDADREAKSTEYVFKKRSGYTDHYKNAWWWLRSRRDDNDRAADVDTDGGIDGSSVHYASGAVRPALRISL